MTKSRAITAWNSFWSRLHVWAMRPAAAIVRWNPVVYMVTIVLLVLAGFFLLHQMEAASMPAPAQATTQEGQSGAKEQAAPSVLNNEVHSYTVKGGAKAPSVQVSVSNNGSSPCCAESPENSTIPKNFKTYADDFRALLTLILASAGLFTLVQGIAAGFSSARFISDAEKSVEKIEKFRSDIEKKYPPVLESIARQRARALNMLKEELERASPAASADEGIDWVNDFYAGIDVAKRQFINSVERAVPYEIAGEDEPARKYVKWLKRLARFYWSKFNYEQSLCYGSLLDLERAEYLLERGLEKTGERFTFQNDLGSIHLRLFGEKCKALPKAPSSSGDLQQNSLADSSRALRENAALQELEAAEKAFQLSKADRPVQLRAYFNLANIEAEFRARPGEYFAAIQGTNSIAQALHKAIGYMKEGLEQASPNPQGKDGELDVIWETKRIPDYSCEGYFNLACYHARLARLEPNLLEVHIKESMEALHVAARMGLMRKKDVDTEFNPKTAEGVEGNQDREGDLFFLWHSGHDSVREQLYEMRTKLSQNKAVKNR